MQIATPGYGVLLHHPAELDITVKVSNAVNIAPYVSAKS